MAQQPDSIQNTEERAVGFQKMHSVKGKGKS